MKMRFLPLYDDESNTASANADEPSYKEALAISMPVRRQMNDWNSYIVCRVPWFISAW
jgi:hypothetical protein